MSVAVERCTAADVPRVMAFIDAHWAQGHVLATDRVLFDWQYGDRRGEGYNLLVAARGEDVLGVLGYVPTAMYDPALADHPTVWLALWMVRDNAGVAGLGLQLLRRLTRLEPHEAIGVLGIGDERHLAMYESLRYETGACTQHVLFDPVRPLTLATLPAGWARPVAAPGDAVLRPLGPGDVDALADELTGIDVVPAKTVGYLRGRFVDHPVYDYRLHAIVRDGAPRGVLVSRVAEHDGARAVRLVDLLGDAGELAHCGPAIEALLVEADAEHADLWCAGVDPLDLARAGFAAVDPDGPLVVPNYFEPFVPRNTRLRYALRADGRPRAIFRADGDQDRPNLLRTPA